MAKGDRLEMSWEDILKQPKLRLSPKTFTAFKIPPKEDKPKCKPKYMQRFEDMIRTVETEIIGGVGDPNHQPEKRDSTTENFRTVIWEAGDWEEDDETTSYSRITLMNFVGDNPDEDFCVNLTDDFKYNWNRPPTKRGTFISGHFVMEPFEWEKRREGYETLIYPYVRAEYYWSFREDNPMGWEVEDITGALSHFEDIMEEIIQKYGGSRV